MDKKILISIITIALASAILTGVTVAYFMDQEISKGNTFAAGTLDLAVSDKDGNLENAWSSKTFDISNVAPGASNSATPFKLDMKNVGNIDAKKLTIWLDNVTDSENDNTSEAETNKDEPGDLCGQITLTIKEGATVIKSDKINDASWTTAIEITGGLDADETRNFTAEYSVDSNANNDIQGDNCTFDIVAQLDQ